MAVINTVTPNVSIQTGDVPVKIEGTGFDTPSLSASFSGVAFYQIETLNNGQVSSPSIDGVELLVSADLDSYSAIVLDNILPEVFDISVDIDRTISTLPSVNDVVIVGIRAESDVDISTYVEFTLRYDDSRGYFSRVESYESGSLLSYEEKAIGPYEVGSLRLYRTDSGVTVYVERDGDWVSMGQLKGLSTYASLVKVFSKNFSTMVVGAYSIWLKRFDIRTAVSYAGYPGDIVNTSDTEINFFTTRGNVTSGQVILGLPDASVASWSGTVYYTQGSLVSRFVANFDFAISCYQEYVNPTKQDLFTSSGGFIWDQDEFIPESKANKNLYIPSLWDSRTARLSSSEFQSGYGFADNLLARNIVRRRSNSQENWYARLNHGTYFINNASYYLFSDQSVTTRLEDEFTADGRSMKSLYFLPKKGIPVAASTLELDPLSGNIIEKRRFNKVVSFTGKVKNGIELNTEAPENIDTRFDEFKVHYNSNNMYHDWKIPVENMLAEQGQYSFFLPRVPLQVYPLIFYRNDIFKQQKFISKYYGDTDAIYGNFPYGTGLKQEGDWMVDYLTGEVTVWLDRDYIDLGYVTFTFDYPAKVEFNQNYLIDKGFNITNPQVEDLSELDSLGESDGGINQFFITKEFPIYDTSEGLFFDTTSFKLYVYNPYELEFDTEWQRVRSLEGYGPNDKVYILESDAGKISFGDGWNGAIPPKYHRIMVGYRTSVRIEYEPESSVDFWTAKSVDLNLSRNNLSAGFLHLTRKEQLPDTITLEFSDPEINALEFSSLKAVVYDLEGDPMSNVEVEFIINNAQGVTEDLVITSNSDGQAETVFLPDARIESMGIFVQLYDAGPDAGTKGNLIEGVFQDNGAVQNAKLILPQQVTDDPNEVYLFKILDAGDGFTPYDNETRKGGVYQVYYTEDSLTGQKTLVRPNAIDGDLAVFNEPLPQSHNPVEPNYDPLVRGFCLVARKTVSAVARTTYKGVFVQSQVASIQVVYSPIQKGEWTLPILPVNFDGSEIDRATYITLNPPRNTMNFTASTDLTMIELEHNTVEPATIEIYVEGNPFKGWLFDGDSSPNKVYWESPLIINQNEEVVVTYNYKE